MIPVLGTKRLGTAALYIYWIIKWVLYIAPGYSTWGERSNWKGQRLWSFVDIQTWCSKEASFNTRFAAWTKKHEKYTAVFVQRYKTTEPTCMFTSVCILVQRGAEHRMSGRFALVSRYTSHIISHSDTHFWPLFYWWGHTQQPHPQHLNNHIYTCAYTLKRMYTHTLSYCRRNRRQVQSVQAHCGAGAESLSDSFPHCCR